MNDNVSSHFSLFDVLGYLIPGALCLMLIKLVLFLPDVNSIDRSLIYMFLDVIKPEKATFSESVFFLIFSYLCGHILGYASSVTIEVFSHWMHGYPSSFLLRQKKPFFDKAPSNQSKGELRHDSVDTPMDDKSSIGFVYGKRERWCFNAFKVIISILIFPVSCCSFILGKLLRVEIFYLKPLDEKNINLIQYKYNLLVIHLGLKYPDRYDADHHRLIYHYVYDKFPSHRAKFDCYVAIYDFLRSVTFLLVCLFYYLLYIVAKNNLWSWGSLISSVILALTSYFMYMAFMKFYRRFTLESFMCLLTDPYLKVKDLKKNLNL